MDDRILEACDNNKTSAKLFDVASTPERLSIVTVTGYTNALNLCNEAGDNAHLELFFSPYVADIINDRKYYIRCNNNPEFNEIHVRDLLHDDYLESLIKKDAHMIIEGPEHTEQKLQIIRDPELKKINMRLLSVMFSILLKDAENKNFENIDADHPNNVVIYIPELCKKMGYKSNLSNQQINDTIIAGIYEFKNLVGVYAKKDNIHKEMGYLGVINVNRYDLTNKTLSFSSPYFSFLIRTIRDLSILNLGNEGRKPSVRATYSYMIKTEIAKQRNYIAVENVKIITALIERTGSKGTPHIKLSTLIERNPYFKIIMNTTDSKHWQQALNRAFKGPGGTYALLRKMTLLEEKYIDIDLHDINEAPTMKDVREDRTLTFAHKGIRTEWRNRDM